MFENFQILKRLLLTFLFCARICDSGTKAFPLLDLINTENLSKKVFSCVSINITFSEWGLTILFINKHNLLKIFLCTKQLMNI